MSISKTGDNLAIVININKKPCEPWMVFCCWYSLMKYLPDASIFILARRDCIESDVVSSWAKRCKIEFSQYNNESWIVSLKEQFRKKFEKTLFIGPDVMAVDVYLNDEIVSSKSKDASTFVSYLDGVGNFVLADCINKNVLPFGRIVERFINSNMSLNESRIIKVWKKAEKLYKATF